MQPNRILLAQFAQAAVLHAADRHGLAIDHRRIEVVDQILDLERSNTDDAQRPSIVLCYGAWIGEWIVAQLDGEWVGLCEPTPPRIKVNGIVCSPMDAVERRLRRDPAPPLAELIERLTKRCKPSESDLNRVTHNQTAWDARNIDECFIRTETLPSDREAARAAIDPWLLDPLSQAGCRILCLAAGGGTHGPLFALAGADVTVVDFSAKQLEIDRQIADRLALSIRTIQTPIDDLSALPESSFDVVVQPVSMSYVRDLRRVYAEIARVLRADGLYLGQHKQPAGLQAELRWTDLGYVIRRPAEEGLHLAPIAERARYREGDMHEFVHTWEAMLGELCRTGFVIEDLEEPPRGDAWAPVGSPEHRATYLPPYVKIKSRRR